MSVPSDRPATPSTPVEQVASVPPVSLEPVRLRRTETAGRVRWAVALGATVLVLAGAVGLAAVAGAGNAVSPTLSYVPADAIAYAEVRLDLPGDQLDQATRLLTRLPGLLDGANLEWKINRALDGLLGNQTGGRFSYSGDVAPWFGGPAAVVLLPGPDAQPRPVAMAAVKDRPAADAFLRAGLAEAEATGAAVTPVTVGGTPGWTVVEADEPKLTLVLTDDMLIAAEDPQHIKPLLDAHSGGVPGLASSDAYREAMAGAPADRVASAFTRASALSQVLDDADAAVVPGQLVAGLVADAGLPEWAMATLRVEADRLILDSRAAAVPGATPAPLRPSQITAGIPATAVVYAEEHGAGTAIGNLVRALRQSPDVAGQLGQLDQLEPLLGVSLDAFFDFVGDAGLVVLPAADGGEEPLAGIVASLSDEQTAAARLTRLRALLALGGGQIGARLTTESYGSATIVTVTFDLPSGGDEAAGLPVRSLSWALGSGRLVVGLTPAFVKVVLDTPAGGGLGDDPGFREALARAGGPTTAGLAYVDLPGLIALAGPVAADAAGDALGGTNVTAGLAGLEPYIGAFESIVAVRGRDGDNSTVRVVLTMSPAAP